MLFERQNQESLRRTILSLGGFISEISEDPTPFPVPNRMGLSWEVQFIYGKK